VVERAWQCERMYLKISDSSSIDSVLSTQCILLMQPLQLFQLLNYIRLCSFLLYLYMNFVVPEHTKKQLQRRSGYDRFALVFWHKARNIGWQRASQPVGESVSC
jgi:hypothetical protein